MSTTTAEKRYLLLSFSRDPQMSLGTVTLLDLRSNRRVKHELQANPRSAGWKGIFSDESKYVIRPEEVDTEGKIDRRVELVTVGNTDYAAELTESYRGEVVSRRILPETRSNAALIARGRAIDAAEKLGADWIE